MIAPSLTACAYQFEIGAIVEIKADGGPLSGSTVRLARIVPHQSGLPFYLGEVPDQPGRDAWIDERRIRGARKVEQPAPTVTHRRVIQHVPPRPPTSQPMPKKYLPIPARLLEAAEPHQEKPMPAPAGTPDLRKQPPVTAARTVRAWLDEDEQRNRSLAARHFRVSEPFINVLLGYLILDQQEQDDLDAGRITRAHAQLLTQARRKAARTAEAGAEAKAPAPAIVDDEEAVAEMVAAALSDDELADLEAELETARDEVEAAHARCAALDRTVDKLRDELACTEEALRLQHETIEQYQANATELAMSRDALELERDRWQAEAARLQAENEQLRRQLAEAQQTPAPLATTNGNGHAALSEVEVLRARSEGLQDALRESLDRVAPVIHVHAGATVVIRS